MKLRLNYGVFLNFTNALVFVEYNTVREKIDTYYSLENKLDFFQDMKLVATDKEKVIFQCKNDKKCIGKVSRSVCKLNSPHCSECVWYEEYTCTKTLNLPGAISIKIITRSDDDAKI